MLSASLLMSGCATWLPALRGGGAQQHLEYFATAATADARALEGLWAAARNNADTPAGDLRKALLQSIPGHSGYNPAGAEGRLASLLSDDSPADVAAMARARLAELRRTQDCQSEMRGLRSRLDKLVDIERNQKNNGN